jgi:hypothetical protein
MPATGDPDVIPARAPLPDLSRAVDLETFDPGDDVARGPLFYIPPAVPRHVTVVGDGTQLLPPPCAVPLRVGGRPSVPITVDGDLADWRGVTPEMVDREGDGATTASGAKIDLLRVFHSADDGNHYFAFVLKDDWPAGDALAYVLLRQEQVQLPATARDYPTYTLVNQLLVQPAAVFESDSGRVTALPAGQFTVATRGRVIELRLARSALEVKARSKTWLLDVSIMGGRADQRLDRAGDLYVGVATDYACLVALPGRRWKMFMLRRADDVDPQQAEIVYRGAINAAPYVESETGESFDLVDTVNVTVVRAMPAAGLHRGASGMTISLASTSLLDLPLAPLDYFETAAHEYAHGINAVDWEVPRLWIGEGHSEQTAHRVVRAAFNAGIAQWRYRAHLYSFVADENDSGIAPLEPEPWQSAGKTGSFFYAKSEAFLDLLSTLLPYQSLNHVLGRREWEGTRYASGTAVLQAIGVQPGFGAPVTAGMWNGWFGGGYQPGALARSIIETDSDGDGLLDYQERALGLDPDSADTDGDGRSDLFELAARTDPRKPEPLSGLVVDNLLTDWDRLGPGLLHAAATTLLTSPACASIPRLVRYGVIFDGDWLVVGAELAAPVANPAFQLLADIRDPSGRLVSLSAQTEPPLVVALEGDRLLRAAPVAAPLGGTRHIEIAYHRSWLGWGAAMPAGVTVRIGTAGATATMASACEASREALAPSRAVP